MEVEFGSLGRWIGGLVDVGYGMWDMGYGI